MEQYRTLKLTLEEVNIIESALNYVGNRKLDKVEELRSMIPEHERLTTYTDIVESANKYFDLQVSISNSDRDV